MSNSHYQELDKLIQEYEDDKKSYHPDKLIIKNYPKLFVMSVASTFEYYIKDRIKDFVASPANPINTTYPQIDSLFAYKPRTPMSDKMYSKFIASDRDGIERLDAGEFYALFGGASFKGLVTTKFEEERTRRRSQAEGMLNSLSALIGTDDKFDLDYAKYSDIKERLDLCTFEKAEIAFLSLKLRRNKVAHNYLNGLSDSFEDVRNFYYDAISYVIALEESILSMTASPA